MVFLLAPKGEAPAAPLRCSVMVQPIGFQNTIPSQARRPLLLTLRIESYRQPPPIVTPSLNSTGHVHVN
jgi:hypothetical protein